MLRRPPPNRANGVAIFEGISIRYNNAPFYSLLPVLHIENKIFIRKSGIRFLDIGKHF